MPVEAVRGCRRELNAVSTAIKMLLIFRMERSNSGMNI